MPTKEEVEQENKQLKEKLERLSEPTEVQLERVRLHSKGTIKIVNTAIIVGGFVLIGFFYHVDVTRIFEIIVLGH